MAKICLLHNYLSFEIFSQHVLVQSFSKRFIHCIFSEKTKREKHSYWFLINDFSIESYRECAKATRLLMFGHLLKESYDKAKTVFLPPDQLPTKKVTLIGQTLEMIVRKSIEQKKKVTTTSWGILRIQDDLKKSEAQDVLDSILKFAYPYISTAKKLTSMNRNLMIQDSSSSSYHQEF